MRKLAPPLALLACAAVLASAAHYRPAHSSDVEAPSAVAIHAQGRNGSAVHIGGGFFLTAAHVAVNGTGMVVHPDGAADRPATVLWASTQYDVALLTADGGDIGSSDLDCRTPEVGEEITTLGNPLGEAFLTSWGRVSSPKRKVGPWESVVFADMTVVPGNSGGPVFDASGDVVGIAVGVKSFSAGLAASLTGISMIVPASAICTLLARP